ncbi:MAG: hypothetical protein K6G51_02560 [Sphaerochaetaceae bacterium]|nr:hypothetical protein [Sphaerochaetaceae bacterium]
MERYEFQFFVGREFSRLVLENKLEEVCSLPQKFNPHEEEARKIILAYLGALSFDESIEKAIRNKEARPVFPLILCSREKIEELPPCPTGALYLDKEGRTNIRQRGCIACGRCTRDNFFAYARTGLLNSLNLLKSGRKVTALIAPSIDEQFNIDSEQLEKTLKQIGFDKVYNVKYGAIMMAQNEGLELEKCIKCSDWMITSCCASVKELGLKLFNVIENKHSSARTPVEYTSEYLKKKDPDNLVIFIGPCFAKIVECSRNKNVDGVLLFSELEMIFSAYGFDFSEGVPSYSSELSTLSKKDGISNAVKGFCSVPAKSLSISGLTRNTMKQFHSWSRDEKPDADLVEIVCCPNGCISGPGNTSRVRKNSKILLD